MGRPRTAKAEPSKSHRQQPDLPAKTTTGTEPLLVVGIGASAGGLEACTKLVDGLASGKGIAFILVQHLDPAHESLMVSLLATHTSMAVRQVADGMPIEPDHFYVIPPGTYLTVSAGALHLSPIKTRGARLPFDHLLHSLATECGARAVCVVLSGTGDDGSSGLKAIKDKGGHVIVQDPHEAAYDGMPLSAIETGPVDLILPVAQIPAALDAYLQRLGRSSALGPGNDGTARDQNPSRDHVTEIIDLLRTNTAYDFARYKRGTLERRIERRLGLAAIESQNISRYLEILRSNPQELDLLAKDLLINVTSFFRDPKVFELLAEKIVPDLLRDHTRNDPLRIWVTGCSTGEETHSLAMLFREQMTAAHRNVTLQIFASDVDPDAIATAREGVYADAIEADVSPARLARFFSKEEQGYKILPELRAIVVFTVQDVLSDPPFSRLDFISCRNLLIYLDPDAQARVLSLFHFALVPGGILLLGSSETLGNSENRFETISKDLRIYRHIGRSRPGDLAYSLGRRHISTRPEQSPTLSHRARLAELCRRLVMESYAPAAILINRKHECLFSLGPTDRYLQVAQGYPTHDLLEIAHPALRNKLRSIIQRATQDKKRILIAGGRIVRDGKSIAFGIDAQPVECDGEQLILICFVDEQNQEPQASKKTTGRKKTTETAQIADIERELQATRMELEGAIKTLERSSEEQRAINEEALSVTEEFQSTNEELTTSKEELQSLNEELTTLNNQLQETLERERTTSTDLQNILYSTNVATLFLDHNLHIRFFTPATTLLFSIIASDVGRPLADLASLSADTNLSADASSVLENQTPIEREIRARTGAWYVRCVLPYRTRKNTVAGVVITFTDITERKHIADALDVARRQAQLATIAKSRFLAAASHDLRQPLQTLALMQGLLAKSVTDERGRTVVKRLDETLSAMSGMLNTLLDINQIEAGAVSADVANFPIRDILDRLKDEFTYHAQAQKIELRVVPCRLFIHSDPRLLEQILRNLLSNAVKYTKRGRVLMGCRRHKGRLSIEIWDTGIGMPADQLKTIFEEYHQIDNPARERSRGLGLGLSIVQNLAKLLGHEIHVRSEFGKGSVFTLDVGVLRSEAQPTVSGQLVAGGGPVASPPRGKTLLIVEDDPEVRELLDLHLTSEDYKVATAPDGIAALALVKRDAVRPDLILADYNLPNGMNGLQVVTAIRKALHIQIPVIILTGDISAHTLHEIAAADCAQLHKPVKVRELAQTIQRLLELSPAKPARDAVGVATTLNPSDGPVVYVVDDDESVCSAIRATLEEQGWAVEDYTSCESFLAAYRPGREACLLVDAYLPGMSGLDFLRRLKAVGDHLPAIMITGNSDVQIAVDAMKAGALDFIEKPVGHDELIATVRLALGLARDSGKLAMRRQDAANQLAALTSREREIMTLVLAGQPSKNIAADLGISQRTVENHRASVMKKTGSKSMPALARLALFAVADGGVAHGAD